MKFLIIDDHPRLRSQLRQLILGEWPHADVREAPTLARALALQPHFKADALLLDLSLPDANGLAGAVRALRALREVPVLALSPTPCRAQAALLLALGASGYLPKADAAAELLPALHRLLVGGRYVTAPMAEQLLGKLAPDLPLIR